VFSLAGLLPARVGLGRHVEPEQASPLGFCPRAWGWVSGDSCFAVVGRYTSWSFVRREFDWRPLRLWIDYGDGNGAFDQSRIDVVWEAAHWSCPVGAYYGQGAEGAL